MRLKLCGKYFNQAAGVKAARSSPCRRVGQALAIGRGPQVRVNMLRLTQTGGVKARRPPRLRASGERWRGSRSVAPARHVTAHGRPGLRARRMCAHAGVARGRVRAGVVGGAFEIEHFSFGNLHLPDMEPEAALEDRSSQCRRACGAHEHLL
jgi:hypothetical protein